MADFKLSVITINRNNAEGLRKTMQSVLDQTSDNFEYIIIDGASTDGSVDVIKDFLEHHPNASKITYWISEPDTGIYNAMNKGIEKANGKYCHMLNSGDWYVDNDVISKLENMNLTDDIVYGNANFVYKDKIEKRNYPEPEKFDECIKNRSPLSHQNTIFSVKLSKKCLYSTEYKLAGDVVFYIELIRNHNATCRHIDFVMVNFDAETGISSIKESENLRIDEWLKIWFTYYPDLLREIYLKYRKYVSEDNGTFHKFKTLYFKLQAIKLKMTGRKK